MPPLIWLIDTLIPGLSLSYGKLDFHGKLLVISEQLWTIIKNNEARSMFIGPSVLAGKGFIKGYPVNIIEPLIAVILDATELRPNMEIPLIDLMNPDIIDPYSNTDTQQIITTIRRVIRKRGQVLFERKISEIKSKASIPLILDEEEEEIKVTVKSIPPAKITRFLLSAGYHQIYSKLVSFIKEDVFKNNMNLLRADEKYLKPLKSACNLEDWLIVEKTAEITDITPPNFITEVLKEFENVLKEIYVNSEKYLIE
jgi:hypothetical protein